MMRDRSHAAPTILRQLERLNEYLYRLLDPAKRRYLRQAGLEPFKLGLICVGPPGTGKSRAVKKALAEFKLEGIEIKDATLHGIIDTMAKDPDGVYWLDDFDSWMSDERMLNFFKHILDPEGSRKVDPKNHLRDSEGFEPFKFNGTVIITSNSNPDRAGRNAARHIAAVKDRVYMSMLSWDPQDRLDLIGDIVCNKHYLQSDEFRRLTNTRNRSLSNGEVQQVLDFMHEYHSQVDPSMRKLIEIATECAISPKGSDWRSKLLIGDNPTVEWIKPAGPPPRYRGGAPRKIGTPSPGAAPKASPTPAQPSPDRPANSPAKRPLPPTTLAPIAGAPPGADIPAFPGSFTATAFSMLPLRPVIEVQAEVEVEVEVQDEAPAEPEKTVAPTAKRKRTLSPMAKQAHAEAQKRYRESPKGKEAQGRHNTSVKARKDAAKSPSHEVQK